MVSNAFSHSIFIAETCSVVLLPFLYAACEVVDIDVVDIDMVDIEVVDIDMMFVFSHSQYGNVGNVLCDSRLYEMVTLLLLLSLQSLILAMPCDC